MDNKQVHNYGKPTEKGKAENKIARIPRANKQIANMHPAISQNTGLINNAMGSIGSSGSVNNPNNISPQDSNTGVSKVDNDINKQNDTGNQDNTNEVKGKGIFNRGNSKNKMIKL